MADKMLKIELKKSLIGRGAKQIATAEALGLKKPGDVTVQPDNAATQGKIAKIGFMLSVTKAQPEGYTHNETSRTARYSGANKAVTRKGRGIGSGNGKTAGFGSKGQKARSGVKHAGFEGGQMPLARRLPKVGFNNIFATQYAIVNVADLEAAFNAGDVVDTEALKAKGLVKKTLDGVKVLGNGELTKALTVKAAAYSASAKEKIEKAGGKAEVM